MLIEQGVVGNIVGFVKLRRSRDENGTCAAIAVEARFGRSARYLDTAREAIKNIFRELTI